jgi:chromosomal replication initiation ATPase DnaA
VQEIISFPKKNQFLFEDFVFLPENKVANQVLNSFFAQSDFALAKLPSLILKGTKACGKTHLLNIFASKFKAKFLQKNQISKENLVKILQKNHFYVFENIDEIQDEELLFHLINSAFEAKCFLLFSAQNIHNFQLKDLTSRLKNIFICEIENLSKESLQILISNQLSRRQIKLSSGAINLICQNCKFDYLAVLEIVNKVEEFCHAQKGEILLKDLRKIFK